MVRVKGRSSLLSFLHHYKRFEFMDASIDAKQQEPTKLDPEQQELTRRIVDTLERRLSVMLGVPLPTLGE
jgi:hypothetical protein